LPNSILCIQEQNKTRIAVLAYVAVIALEQLGLSLRANSLREKLNLQGVRPTAEKFIRVRDECAPDFQSARAKFEDPTSEPLDRMRLSSESLARLGWTRQRRPSEAGEKKNGDPDNPGTHAGPLHSYLHLEALLWLLIRKRKASTRDP